MLTGSTTFMVVGYMLVENLTCLAEPIARGWPSQSVVKLEADTVRKSVDTVDPRPLGYEVVVV